MTKYLLLDLAQQSNCGDDIMQRTLFEFFADKGDVRATSYFGANEFDSFNSEFSNYSYLYNKNVSAGFFNTRYKAFLTSKSFIGLRFKRTFVRVFDLLNILFLLLVISAKISDSMLIFFIGKKRFEVLKLYRSADCIIWNGRNFRGAGSLISEFMKVFELCANPLLCLVLNKPIYCVGASIWPIRGRFTKLLLKRTLGACNIILVREAASISILNEIIDVNEKVIKIPDLSFFMLDKYLDRPLICEQKNNVVSITLVGKKEIPNKDTYERYLAEIAQVIRYLSFQGIGVQIVPQVTYRLEAIHEEIQYLDDVLKIENLFKVCDPPKTLEQLVEIYQKSIFLIASRMHSAIFALSSGTSVIALSYDSGAKWSILKELSLPTNSLKSIDELEQGWLLNRVKSQLAQGIENKINNNVSVFAREIREQLELVCENAEDLSREKQ